MAHSVTTGMPRYAPSSFVAVAVILRCLLTRSGVRCWPSIRFTAAVCGMTWLGGVDIAVAGRRQGAIVGHRRRAACMGRVGGWVACSDVTKRNRDQSYVRLSPLKPDTRWIHSLYTHGTLTVHFAVNMFRKLARCSRIFNILEPHPNSAGQKGDMT
jgi:hypothetical protein